MASLPNYLRTHRRRLTLSQEEVGFLIGVSGGGMGAKACRHELSARLPDLRTALAYEAVYGRTVRELFAGLYEEAEQAVAARAAVLRHRTAKKPNPKRQEAVNGLAARIKN